MPKLPDVADFPIQNNPGNPCLHSGLRNLRKTGSAYWLENNAVRVQLRRALNELQNLLALQNAVVIGVYDLHSNAEVPRNFFGRGRLFHLVIVILGEKRNYNCRLLGHKQMIRRKRLRAGVTGVIRARRARFVVLGAELTGSYWRFHRACVQ